MPARRSLSIVSFAIAAVLTTALPGQGQPWLHAPIELATMVGEFLLLGDVDLDGDLDGISFAANGNAIKTSFTVWSNDGTGTFAASAPVPLPANAGIHVELADVDGDGRGDLVLSVGTGSGGNGLLLFPGQSGGTFGPYQLLPLPGIVTYLRRGNGNGDGFADLLVHHAGGPFPGTTRWVFGAAGFALTLGPAATLPLPIDRCVVDANGDGLDDVALPADTGTGPTDVLEFHVTTPTGFAPGPTLPLPSGFSFKLATLDHDGDGDRDVLVASAPGSILTITLCTNLGGGAWTASTNTISGGSWGTLHVGDWNGDGREEIGMRTTTSGGTLHHLALYETLASGGLALGYSLPMGGSTTAFGAGFGDLNLDGHTDFLDSKSVWFGDGTFTAPFGTNNTTLLRDWDGDGDQDLLPFDLSLHDGNGGVTAAPFTFPPLPANHVYDNQRLVTDLDGDGRHEILVGVLEVVFFQYVFRATHLLREGADGQFTFAGHATPAPGRVGRGVVVDTDGDGDLDIVNGSGLWRQDGVGFFTPQGAITTGYEPVASGDVDGDGDADLLATTTGGGTSLAVLYRTAPNTWSTTVLFPSAGSTIEPAAPKRFFDVDDDGDLDVVAREHQANGAWRALVFTNQDGVFTQALALPHPGQAMVGDVDGDGLSDLAFYQSFRLQVLRRTGPGLAYAPPVTFVTPACSDLVDFDQDGDLDVTGDKLVQNRRFHGALAGHRRQYGNGSLGAGGWRPILSMRGPIREGLVPTMSLRRAPGGTIALLVFGSGATDVPSVVLQGVQSYVAPIDLLLGFTVGGALGQPGAGELDVPVSIPPGLGGVHAFLELVVFDPTVPFAFTHTNGCELAIGR